MLFASVEYLVFLPVVVLVYWATPRSYRSAVLLAASYLFYMAFVPVYGLLVFGLAVTNYLFGLWISRTTHRDLVLAAAIIVDLGTLIYFKYTNFLVETFGRLLHQDTSWFALNVILPLGISFFTFEFIHYVVDIRRGSVPIHDFTNFHVFAAFFPSQIAGPIKRFQPFNEQVRARLAFDALLFEEGCWLVLRGLAKKIVLADNLAPIVGAAFAAGGTQTTASAWLGAYAFAFQIYFDFSGYTDIGRGSAQLLGFRLPENFRTPYLAVGLRDFWRRWHMSLSSWLRDYVYIPLGGNRSGEPRARFNVLITMALGGLWHGAALHFVVWGLLHGVALVAERSGASLFARFPSSGRPARVLRVAAAVFTFQFVCVGWVLFRANGAIDASRYIGAMFGLQAGSVTVAHVGPILFTLSLYAAALVGERLISGVLGPHVRAPLWPGRALVYACVAVASILLIPQTIQRFIYFQF